ncbi:MAG: hypothetical protein LBV43_11745 [Prevotella sp.]|jgi:hypothetical protein|nr:hypothetical protein [Prevotella sp.]
MCKTVKTFFFVIIASVFALFTTSCEYDADGDNYHELEQLPSQMGVYINLANHMPGSLIYIYGPTAITYRIEPDVGQLRSIKFRYYDEVREDYNSTGSFMIEPEASDAGVEKDLEVDIEIVAKDNSLAGALGGYLYSATVDYKIKYVRITADDFTVKSREVDKVVLQMINKPSDPCKFVIDGKEIADLDDIVFERTNFPENINTRVYLLPENASVQNFDQYNYVQLKYQDDKLGGPDLQENASSYIDEDKEELYVWSSDRLYIHDKGLNIISSKDIRLDEIAVTPETGLIVCRQQGNAVTYADKSFSTVVSTINNIFPRYRVNEKDQLIQGHNFQVDVFDLHMGLLVYSINFPDGVSYFDISKDGKYLFVRSGEANCVYLLNNDSASLVYSSDRPCVVPRFHPINKYHIVLDNLGLGFEVFDIETQQTVFSSKGEFQSIDPVTGNLLYYDENYDENYQNRFVDASYNEIYVLINTTSYLIGDFKLFNNNLIKGTYYIDITSKLTNE